MTIAAAIMMKPGRTMKSWFASTSPTRFRATTDPWWLSWYSSSIPISSSATST